MNGLGARLIAVVVVLVLLLCPAPLVAQSSESVWSLPEDFGSVQGRNQWYYYREYADTYISLVWDPYVNPLGNVGNCWSPQVGGSDHPRYLYIQGASGKVVIQPGENADAAIGWQAPRAGTVTVSATMTAVSTSTQYPSSCPGCVDDGIDFSIRHNAAIVAGPTLVLHGSTTAQITLAATVTVAEGDFLYFYVDRREWQDGDAAYADFDVSYEGGVRTWEAFDPAEHVGDRLSGVAVPAWNNAWAVGSGGTILRYQVGMGGNIGSWTREDSPTTDALLAVDVVSSGEGWAVGQGGVALRRRDGAWTLETMLSKRTPVEGGTILTPVDVYSVDMLSTTVGWAVGDEAAVFHYAGGQWTEDPVTGAAATAQPTLYDVHMLSTSDGWAVGDGGTVLHYDGTSWNTVPAPTGAVLRSVYMVSASDGWAVGSSGTILRYTSGAWQTATSPTTESLYAVAMTGTGEGSAAGESGGLLRYSTAGGWQVQTGLTGNTLRSVAIAPGGYGWAVGSGGTVLRYGPPTPTLQLTARPTIVDRGGTALFVLTVRDSQGSPLTDATVTATLWSPVSVWGGGPAAYQAASNGYVYSYTVPSSDPIGAYRVQFRVQRESYVDTTEWGYFGVGGNENVRVLLLTNYPRMRRLGYTNAEVAALQSKVYDLAYGNPNGLGAVMNLDGLAGYSAWAANPGDAGLNNTLVDTIDAEIERMRRDVYPNLAYVIVVGSSEVIPMNARSDDPTWVGKNEDEYWADSLTDASYVHSLCYHGADGRYLTDNIYADLAYLDHDGDHVLTPELMVGRLVETPVQIGRLIDAYLRLGGEIDASAVVMAGHDQLDTGSAVFSGYPGGVDRTLHTDSYSPAAVPEAVSPGNVYVFAGHASRNNVSTGQGSFSAGGCSDDEAGIYDEATAEGSVMFTVACHAAVSLGNRLHGDPATDDRTCPVQDLARYLEFPENWAALGMMAYAGSTSYAMGTASGTSDYSWMAGGTENLVELMTSSGLLVGRTVGQAWRDGINSYWDNTGQCVFWLPYFGCLETVHTDYNRKAVGGYVLYGIPTLRVNGPSVSGSGLDAMVAEESPAVRRELLEQAAAQVVEQVTVEIPDYRYLADAGAVEIPGADQRVVPGEPYLPVLRVERTLPTGAQVTEIAVDQAASTWVEIDGRLSVPALMGGDTAIPNGFTAGGFYPVGPALALDRVSDGGRSATAGMTLIPVQYNQATSKIRVWTKLVVNVTYSVPDTGVALASLTTNKGSYGQTESVSLTAGVTAGAAHTVQAIVRVADANTGTVLGEVTVAEALALSAGTSNQSFSFALSGFGASLEGKEVRIELQLHDAALGTLLASRDVSVTVGDRSVPCKPAGLRAYPGDGRVTLAWQPCSQDDVWVYRVSWGTSPSALGQSTDVPASTSRYVVPGLTDFTTYYFAVAAVDVTGNVGARSAVISAVPGLKVYLPQTSN